MAAPMDDDTPRTVTVTMTTGSTDDDTPRTLEAGQGQHHTHIAQETTHNELAEDHIYTVKFTFSASRFDQVKRLVNDYIGKMLNHLGIVFFKAQPFYRSHHGHLGAANDRGACLIEFHLFSIECLNQDTNNTIHEYVSKYLYPEDPYNKLEDLQHDVFIRHKTQLRKPVYTYVILHDLT